MPVVFCRQCLHNNKGSILKSSLLTLLSQVANMSALLLEVSWIFSLGQPAESARLMHVHSWQQYPWQSFSCCFPVSRPSVVTMQPFINVVVQVVSDSATLWTAARQASLFLTIFWSLPTFSSCPLSPWCHPTISSSVTLFSFCLLCFPASGSEFY